MIHRLRRLNTCGRLPEDIEVWHLHTPPTDLPLWRAAPYLNDSERQRAVTYRRAEDRYRFAMTRSALRQLLGQYLGKKPTEVSLTISNQGRPELTPSRHLEKRRLAAGLPSNKMPSFNISHAGEHALFVVSPRHVVGIDIEPIDIHFPWCDIATSVFNESERAVMEAQSPQKAYRMFFRAWTAKEALLKAYGTGITNHLKRVPIDALEKESGMAVLDFAEDQPEYTATRFVYRWIEDIEGYMGCVSYASTSTKD